MNKATYQKLADNPHYKLSKKQQVIANELDIHTQQMQPEDLKLVTFRGKREPANRSQMSSKKNDKKTQ